MGRVARLRKLNLRAQRKESLDFAAQNIEARKAEIKKAAREEKAQKMSEEFGISKEVALKILSDRSKIRKEKKKSKKESRSLEASENNLQSAGTEEVTAEGKEN